MADKNGKEDKLSFNKAYQEVRLVGQEQGEQSESMVSIEGQALYRQQVDHHIEEVGIMAVKEVRYVTEKQWEKMIQMQKNQQQIWKYLEKISQYGKRYDIARKIPRNEKGRFTAKQQKKTHQPPANRPIAKKGRPRKNRSE